MHFKSLAFIVLLLALAFGGAYASEQQIETRM